MEGIWKTYGGGGGGGGGGGINMEAGVMWCGVVWCGVGHWMKACNHGAIP